MDIEQSLDDNHDSSQKKGRHRKKQLYKSILQQMEFYFSDSNLTKERFLGQLIQTDPYVDVAIFLQFNKIRKLTSSLEDVTKAISKSDLIELSEDKTKVRRKVPVKLKENVDECTIYVERLKSDATHEWLSSIFSEFGKVVYVSIPKYSHSNIIKGFAFIEFETEESANATLNFFESIDCKIPSVLEPHKLCSISTFDNNEKKNNTLKNEQDKDKKRKVSSNSFDDFSNMEQKKKKKKSDSHENDNQKESSEENPKLDLEDCQNDSSAVVKEQDTISESEGEEKKRKKQKKAHKKRANLKEIGLQVLSKKNWKKMRNRYLEMQRKSMAELKKHLYKQRSADSFAPKKKLKENAKETESDDVQNKIIQEFVPGIIVKVSLSEPFIEGKKLKEELKTNYTDIQYIDIPHAYGSQEIYIRFKDNKSADDFCTSDFKGNKSCILEGEEEQKYWQKIEESRNAKLKNANRKQRGRDKLLKKAEKQTAKHIRFDNSD